MINTDEEQTGLYWRLSRYPCIHQIITEQASRTPEHVALVYQGENLTYAQLDEKSSQLANYLVGHGVRKNSFVGICLDRSFDMVVSILGVLKAGAAYVPLDPGYPDDRIAFMLDDIKASALITNNQFKEKLEGLQTQLINLDECSIQIASIEKSKNNVEVSAEDLCYVIYTSGSTGKPKGVLVNHRNLVHSTAARLSYYQDPVDRFLLLSSFSFDSSVAGIFWTLCSGGTLYLPRQGEEKNVADIARYIAENKITHTLAVPTLYQHILDQHDNGRLDSLRLVIVAGETCPVSLATNHLNSLPGCRLFNEYGPTEVTVWSTVHEVLSETTVTIGQPIKQTDIYLFDENMVPVKNGDVGELYLGGPGVAQGYLDQPETTAEKFITHPVLDNLHARIYKTGDLVRLNKSNELEFIGRTDDQVKIRGYRVELGEIETTINHYPGIENCVVAVKKRSGGQPHLIAYFVSVNNVHIDIEALRDWSATKLPSYMLPSIYEYVNSFPLTPGGKIDRNALPDPDFSRLVNIGAVQPRNQVEKQLCDIWKDVLKLPELGIFDNFFEIGGDSILGILISSKASQIGLHVTPTQLFQYPTIAELARVVHEKDLVHAQQEIVTGEVCLTAIQKWFFEQDLGNLHHWNQAILVNVKCAMDKTVLIKAIKCLLRQHDALRMRYQSNGKEWKQLNSDDLNTINIHYEDCSHLTENEQSSLICEKSRLWHADLNLIEGPLLSVGFFNCGPGQSHRLFMSVHHLVIDGISWRVILEDLQTAYSQLENNEDVKLPVKTTSFQYWAKQLEHYSQGPEVLDEIEFWCRTDKKLIQNLPQDNTADSNRECDTATYWVSLDQEQTRMLLRDIHGAYNTQINDILLCALAITISDWLQSSNVLIDLEGHGREGLFDDVDLSRTVGWFTSIFPVLLETDPERELGETIKSIKEQLRLLPKKGIGFGLLKYINNDDNVARKLAAIPQPEISFNYLGQFDQWVNESGMFSQAQEQITDVPFPGLIQESYDEIAHRKHILDIIGAVSEDSLSFAWTYNRHIHTESTIRSLADNFRENLLSIIAHCHGSRTVSYTPSDFPDANLTQEQLDKLIADRGDAQNIESIYPLSPLQQGMLFHTLKEPHRGHYYVQEIYNITGELDYSLLQQACKRLAERHAILRTGFSWEHSDEPLQLVYRSHSAQTAFFDWRHFEEKEQIEKINNILQQDRSSGFDFISPPMKWAVIQLGDKDFQLIWSFHHALLDAWSFAVLVDELFSIYESDVRREEIKYYPCRPYKDYINFVFSQDKNRQKKYWMSRLSDLTGPAPLNMFRQDYSILDKNLLKTKSILVSKETTQGLVDFSQKYHFTLNTLVQGAWAILLSKYSGQDDVIYGMTVAGRSEQLSQSEDIVGLLINTLPTRVQLPQTDILSEWLTQLQQQLQESLDYQLTSLVDIQQWCDLPVEQPLFNTILVFQNYRSEDKQSENEKTIHVQHDRTIEQTHYPLTVTVVPGTSLTLEVEYQPAYIAESAVDAMFEQFSYVLEQFLLKPHSCLSEITLCDDQSYQRLVYELNATQKQYAERFTVIRAFDQQVTLTPDNIAVEYAGNSLSYAELAYQVNQLANYLGQKHIGPESLVGLCVTRSFDMIVAMLAILKSGAAYVPLDPAYPQERLAYMVADAKLSLVICQKQTRSIIEDQNIDFFVTDEIIPTINRTSYDDAEDLSDPQRLAYVIYTSGSTGAPKGVMVEHAALLNYACAARDEFQLTSNDRMLQFSSISFDAAVEEIYTSLLCGATLVLRSESMMASSEAFFQEIDKQGLTSVSLATAFWHQLVTDISSIILPSSLRLIILGGEKVAKQKVLRWYRYVNADIRLINSYGPTEATVVATMYDINPQELSSKFSDIPIGRPVSNVQIYALDSNLYPVPVGVVGELYIGGAGLARGYLGQPELTSKKFIDYTFADGKQSRLYQTGDLVRYSLDGNIEYVGRKDQQVKIRGYRIEPGEIERIVLQMDAVQDAVVIAHEFQQGDMRLLTYVVPVEQKGDEYIVDSVRSFLIDKLPRFMLPDAIIPITQFSFSATGKVDRKALPVPDAFISKVSAQYKAPRSTLEKSLVEIWQTILVVESIGIDDNLFELGGHSILVMQIVSRINQTHGIKVPLNTIFNNPTIAQLANALEVSGSEQMEVGVSVRNISSDDEYPLSFSQERLWFLGQLDSSDPSYNLPVAWHIKGSLNVIALNKAFNRIIERHSILRSIFYQDNEGVKQKVLATRKIDIPVIDVPGSMSVVDNIHLQSFLDQDLKHIFDLTKGPLIKPTLYRLSNGDHVFSIIFNHIVCDGWSIDVFKQDLSRYYRDYKNGTVPADNTLEYQYVDYIDSQRHAYESGQWEKQLVYWKAQLSDLSQFDLPADEPRSSKRQYSASEQIVTLDTRLVNDIMQLAQKNDSTLFMVLVAAFQLLIHRLTGHEDIAIGTPVAGRNQAEFEPNIGLFLNNLVLRGRITNDMKFFELLSQVRETVLNAFSNQDIPFEKLVDLLQPDRQLGRNPLFDVFINLYNDKASLQLDGLQVESKFIKEIAAKFDLSCNIENYDGKYVIRFVYKTGLFSDARMSHMLMQYLQLLEQVTDDPRALLSHYSLVTPESKYLLPSPYETPKKIENETVTTLFANWVNKAPNFPAIKHGDHCISYSELNKIAHDIARRLMAQGIKQGDVVAILGVRNVGFITSVLGVMLSGGVVLPVDCDLPEKRQQFMVSDTNASLLIYSGDEAGRPHWLQNNTRIKQVNIDAQTGKCLNPASVTISGFPQISHEDSAYIFYTSGTTGNPKGISGHHGGLGHFISWQSKTFGINTSDKVAFLTNISFDVVLRDIFLPLVSGATICLPVREQDLAILPWLKSENISILHAVPSLAESWLNELKKNIVFDKLRYTFFAGERLTDTLVNRWRSSLEYQGEIINLYGPTETVLAKCFFRVPQSPLPGVQPLGKALPGCQALVLSSEKRPCGIGEPGEIVIKTPFALAGYINPLETDRQAFIQNPFSDTPDNLVYFTGDLARYRPDGLLDIIGRNDNQVKIRGVRIEPAEVSTILNQHDTIQSSYVMAREDDHGELFLCAYIVVEPDHHINENELMLFLSDNLPITFVPSVYVSIDQVPLTSRGKVDHRALPEPQRVVQQNSIVQSQPRTPVEESLINIWSDILDISGVDIRDNFFRLGGHSLLIIQMLSRIRNIYNVDLPVRSVFEAPCILDLANRIESELKQISGTVKLPTIKPHGDTSDLPLTFSQRRLWFLDQLEPGNAFYNIFNSWRMIGELNVECLKKSIDFIVKRHASLRTSIIDVDGSPRQNIMQDAVVDLAIHDVSHENEKNKQGVIEELAFKYAQTPFDLAKAPLLRMCLIKSGPSENILFIIVHHIVSDGWSMGLLLDDLMQAYEAYLAGVAPVQTELSVQYADYAVWQQQWLDDKQLDNLSNYWKQQLENSPSILELPTDHARPAKQTFKGSTRSVTLPDELCVAIEECAKNENVTLFMFLLAGFQLLLHRYSRSDDIVVGSPIAGRNYSEIENIIGLFVNTLVLRTRFTQNMDFYSLLADVKATVLESFTYQDMPFEKLVEVLQPDRDLSHSPIFQVSFALQNVPGKELQSGGLAFQPCNLETGTAKFDLTLVILNADGKLTVDFNFNSDLFEAKTIDRMAKHYQVLLENAVANMEKPVDSLPLLSGEEQQVMLYDWNNRYTASHLTDNVMQQIERRAIQSPDAVAVNSDDMALSYAELNSRANKLANYLIGQNVRPENTVGLCVARTPEMVVGILGILKAGGCYVPMDPGYPEKRLQFYLQDSDINILLADKSTESIFSDYQDHLILLDEDWPIIETSDAHNPGVNTGQEQLAYIIYTSGSTGLPKGVMVSHANLMHSTNARLQYYQKPVGCFCLLSSYAFDSSVAGLFWTLCSGGALYLPESGIELDIDLLNKKIEEKNVTHILCVPTLYSLIINHENTANISKLETVIVAGESCPPELFPQHYQRFPQTSLFNEYGPTEATVWSTVYEFNTEQPFEQVPIGRPIRDAEIYILNSALQPVPVGVTGEIFIGGRGVARGYQNREQLTAARFINNTFSNDKGSTIYRTGDLAKYCSDGNIVFIGRVDEQVKLRGYRIELGEIESVLNQFTDVAQSVVSVREDRPGDRRLVAYYCNQGKKVLNSDDMRSYMKNNLPEYMVPYVYMKLGAIPLTPNGKIDRKSLPAPDLLHLNKNKVVAPRTELEQQICEIWKEILGQDQIGIDDNFFNIGGHSLLLTRIAARVRSVLSVDVPLRAYFEAPTIAEMAVYITTLQAQDLAEEDLLKLLEELDDLPGDS